MILYKLFQKEYPEVKNQVISSTKSVSICCIKDAMLTRFYPILFCKTCIMNSRWVLDLNFSRNMLIDDDVQNYPVFSPSTEVAGFTPFDCISIPPVSISLDPRHLPFLTPTSSLLLQLFSSMRFLADLFFFYP